MSLLLGLQFLQIDAEPIEARFPQAAVVLEPVIDSFEDAELDPAGPPLRLAPPCDQAGPLEHLEMLGDRGTAHLERLGELADRRLAGREARQDRAPRRVGEGREGRAETIGWHT